MLKTSHNEGAKTSASSSSNLFRILSGPHVFCDLKLRRTLTTSISMSVMLENSAVVDVESKGGVVNDSGSLGLRGE